MKTATDPRLEMEPRTEIALKEPPLVEPHRDPLTGENGAHPVGVGVGALAGGASGAVIGMAGGPVATAVGAAVGAILGGLTGKGLAEAMNPSVEETYWKERYESEPYVTRDLNYEDYLPAYRAGYMGYSTYGVHGRSFEEAEADLKQDYERDRGASRLSWAEARPAARAAWDRIAKTLPRPSSPAPQPEK